MTIERMQGIAEEIKEVETLSELKALHCFGQSNNNEYADASVVAHFKVAAKRLKNQEVTVDVAALEAEVARLQAMLAPTPPTPPVKVTRGSKRYKLLSDDVSWSTKPQVHAVMSILRAHVEVGGTLNESTIVAAMVANEAVLETRQGGKRIWDYYKGRGADGLLLHGNVEIV